MGDKSAIQWTEATWNPIRGCRRKNKDCINCYAEAMAARFSGQGQPYDGLAVMTANGPRWTGEIRVIDEHMYDPLRWQRPRLIFVNSMSDMFYEDLTFTEITRIVAVMTLARRHTFQVLTKRPERMAEYLTAPGRAAEIAAVASAMAFNLWPLKGRKIPMHVPAALKADRHPDAEQVFDRGISSENQWTPEIDMRWPLPNVWWGASMGHQAAVDEFGPYLIQARPNAQVLWASVEPQLELITLAKWLPHTRETSQTREEFYPGLDWVVVGGESGPGARPFDLAWARSIVQQCQAASVPVFLKQLGANPFDSTATHLPPAELIFMRDKKGGDIAEFPEALQIREWPAAGVQEAQP